MGYHPLPPQLCVLHQQVPSRQDQPPWYLLLPQQQGQLWQAARLPGWAVVQWLEQQQGAQVQVLGVALMVMFLLEMVLVQRLVQAAAHWQHQGPLLQAQA
jgi:hypothetical protein